MDLFAITAIAVGLSLDTFAVSLSYGVVQNRILFWQAVRIAMVFAVIQAGLTVIGYFLGATVSEFLKASDHWIALGLLGFLGVKMIIGGLKREEEQVDRDYGKPLILLTAAVGTSIDAFAVGVSFAFLDFMIWISGIVIGAVTFIASMTAIRIGKSAGKRLGGKVEIVGGIILIGIGIKIVVEHLSGG